MNLIVESLNLIVDSLNLIVVVVVVVVVVVGSGSVSIPPGDRDPRSSVPGDPTSIGDASELRAGGMRAANGGGGSRVVGADAGDTGGLGGRRSAPRLDAVGCHASPSDSSLLL